MLDPKNCALVVIDVQEKLVGMLAKDKVADKTATLVEAAKILNVPIIVTEQYPKGLGETVCAVKSKLSDNTPIVEKTAFSACLESDFVTKLNAFGKKQVVICGIETHVCVHQTTSDLLLQGFEVYVAKDACASREKYEFNMGIEQMQANGAKISCVEIILFEWLKTAKHPNFKQVQALIK